jgi:hypothetical protein
VGSDGLGYAYVDPSRLVDAAVGRLSGGAGRGAAAPAQALSSLLSGSGMRSIAASLDAAPDALRVDAALLGAKDLGAGAGDGPGAAAAVPADAWLSVGIGDVGAALRKAVAQQGSGAGLGGLSVAQITALLQQRLGIDLERDFLSWMGDGAVFVRGTSSRDLGGALVVTSKDPAASTAAIGKLDRLLTTFGSAPRPLRGVAGAEGLVVPGPQGRTLEIAAKDDRFVVAVGHDALTAALAGGAGADRLGDTTAYKNAAALLEGVKPSLFLDTPAALKLVESFMSDDAGFQRAKPTLDVLGPAAAGLERQGGVTHLKAAVGLR